MNKLYAYLTSRLGKKTCPIKVVSIDFNCKYNSLFQETLIIEYKDGTIEEFIPKPKTGKKYYV